MNLLNCRLITHHDFNDILRWRNDPISRQMSKQKHFISRDEHSIWFEEFLNDPKSIGFLGTQNKDKVGVVFFRVLQRHVRVSINICPNHRGKRLGGQLLRVCLKEFINLSHPIDCLIAEIRNKNLASIKMFTSIGFTLCNEEDFFSTYSAKPKDLRIT